MTVETVPMLEHVSVYTTYSAPYGLPYVGALLHIVSSRLAASIFAYVF